MNANIITSSVYYCIKNASTLMYAGFSKTKLKVSGILKFHHDLSKCPKHSNHFAKWNCHLKSA